ncbi:hypothetical protein [Nitrospirillum viridazoti]|uniref:Uncharacterized protein n=1 Tax=Nitrospirillum amazonense TaxID=28077 RepID=A0A560HU39_9PROT|nr:hypothetical protein [Nitrospirillum amazonense]TWB48664.1 hypothetical protein FBZ92_12943 [Nitrospirillum amazonense]
MTTVTATQTAVTTGFAARLSAFVEAAGMLSVAAVMALCINAML